MKNNQKGSAAIWVIIILILVIIVGGFIWYQQQNQSQPVVSSGTGSQQTQQNINNQNQPVPPVQQTNSQTTNSNAASPKTYTNTQYGFSINYPSTVTINPQANEGEQILNGALISFYAKNPQTVNGFAYGYVAVHASSDPQVVARCISGTSGVPNTNTQKTTINGVLFTLTGTGSAAAGTQESLAVYNTVHNNTCYSIQEDEYSHYQGGKLVTSQAQADLESIVKSFQFTK